MRVAICDDSASHLLTITKKIQKILDRYNVEDKYKISIQEFSRPNDILLAHEKLQFDVAFLDVDMPNLTGFDVADLMYNLNPRIKIIYVTSHGKYIKDSINHEVFGFITKGNDEDYEEAIQKVLKDYDDSHDPEQLEIIPDNVLTVSDIMYFTSSGNYVIAHTINGDIRLRYALTEIEERYLKRYCFRIDRSTVVNFYHVYNVIGRNVNLYDGTVLKVSRDRAKDIRQKHRMYCIDRDTVFDDNFIYLEADEIDDSPLTANEFAKALKIDEEILNPPKRRDKWWKI